MTALKKNPQQLYSVLRLLAEKKVDAGVVNRVFGDQTFSK